MKEYEQEFLKVVEYVPAIRINRGLEVDFAPRFESKVSEFVNHADWDILLCSVHEFDNARDIEKGFGRTSNREDEYKQWRDYLRLEQLALESDFIPFNVLSHPVRMSKALVAAPVELDDLLLQLAITAKRRSKALELNGSEIDYAPQVVRKLAMACAEAGCKVSLGSDAHYPREVFRNLGIAMSLVEQFKLETYGCNSSC